MVFFECEKRKRTCPKGTLVREGVVTKVLNKSQYRYEVRFHEDSVKVKLYLRFRGRLVRLLINDFLSSRYFSLFAFVLECPREHNEFNTWS